MVGSIVIWIAFAAMLVASSLYFLSSTKQKLLLSARTSFYVSIFGVITASTLLMLYILQHRFEYNYVSSYSSRDLPTELLITTFWAGQEGSFMLWALFAAVIGLFLQAYSNRKQMESQAMTAYSLVLAFLLFLIAIKSPFQYVWDVQKDVARGFIPQDGRGLNPLLQNFWMIIHPPVLFLGFASLAVPFVLAIAALWQKRYSDWMQAALPWVLFSALSLGAGLMLGGYWAYGVLGWGGWWGWDPVENSSLIPWIVAVILVHTLLIQMLTGRLIKTNFILAVLAYLLVVYSTFLTRSGILANASVHSFVDPGALAYTLLVIWLAMIALGGFGMIVLRRKELDIKTPPSNWLTRESLLSIATIVMGVCAAVIFFGTSKPLFSSSTVDPSFYDKTNFPFAVLMTLLLGLSLRTKWNQADKQTMLKRLIIPSAMSIVALIVLIILGLHDVFAALLVLSSLFALFIAIDHGYRVAKEQPRFIGGSLAHIGLAILFIGIIASGKYGQKQSVSLPINQPQAVFGDTLTYIGTSMTTDGKAKCEVKLTQNGKQTILQPVMFESTYNNSVMRNPDYISYLTKDFYIEPISLEEGSSNVGQNILALSKGEPILYGPIQITFVKFDLGSHDKNGMMGSSGDAMTIGAVLEVKTEKDVQTIIPVTTFQMRGQPEMKTGYLKSGTIGFQLISMNVATNKGSKSSIHVNVVGLGSMSHGSAQKPETLIAEVSIKPFMSFVWTAAVLIVLGLVIAMVRRLQQNKNLP
jgi:cytochrome c-type biogenesis protein CcmF